VDGGEVSGIRHAELVNWTGQALLCPRNRVPELAARWQSVVSRPGVYLLLGADQLAAREVYIGEAGLRDVVRGSAPSRISSRFGEPF
jgi:hypothetical protein